MATKKKQASSTKQGTLFPLGAPNAKAQTLVRPATRPVWTENKAKLIETYLRLFVMITHHGVYIDAFAGPQQPDKPDTWAARLVLMSKPRWFRKFFLFEIDKEKVQLLEELRAAQPAPDKKKKEPKREINIFAGDANEAILRILNERSIRMKDATFCLLDQHTNQCDWATVQALARYKTGNKIELFYFFANKWLPRSLAALKDRERARKWWGNDDWEKLRDMRPVERAELLAERFRTELGYKHAVPWPIYDKKDGSTIMFFMVHATDHPAATGLMDRAYHKAVISEKDFKQVAMAFDAAPPSRGGSS